MILDILLVGSLIGYAVHRGHHSPGESFSEFVWIILGIVGALFLCRPTAGVLQLEPAVGVGLGNVLGFIVVSIVFLALRHFFLAAHHRRAVREQREKAAEEEEPTSILPFSWLSVSIGCASGAVTLSFALLLWSAIPASVFPGNDAALSGSVLSRSVIAIAEPISPILDDLIVAAWLDAESLVDSTIARGESDPGNGSFTITPKEEVSMLAAINDVRLENRVQPLKSDEGLQQVARDHGIDMAMNNFFAHNSPTKGDLSSRIAASGVVYNSVGENLAKARSVSEAMTALMESPGHRENLLHPSYSRVGIGAASNGSGDRYYVQEFAD